MKIVKSPLTGSSNVTLERKIACASIIDGYKSYLQLNVKKYFNDLDLIEIYKCNDSGLRFYHPNTVEGDADFYKELQVKEWYYGGWRWENEVANKVISTTDKVLEIGCGDGNFLKVLNQRGVECVGLELNDDVVSKGQSNGLTILNEDISIHADKYPSHYDCIVFFQVLEHIRDVKEFIFSALQCLKAGGKMIIAVPNNDALFFNYYKKLKKEEEFRQKIMLMNMPPHHLGLWNKTSLKNISLFFNINVDSIYTEPFPDNRLELVTEIVSRKLLKVNNRITRSFIYRILKLNKKRLHGTSLLAVYTKLPETVGA